MRISELARTAGLPVATVKYYLRDGLLPPGRATSATQAEYDETHVRRLRLVRALAEIGGLPLADIRLVLRSVDGDPAMSAIARAHSALPPAAPDGAGTDRALAVMERLGWRVDPQCNALGRLQAGMDALEAVGMGPGPEWLEIYARAALLVAEADVDSVPRTSTSDAVEHVVIGTVLYEQLLLALRRLAQQHLFVTRRPDG